MSVERDDPRLPPIIGLHGVARSGKDTVAGLLQFWGYRRVAFADPVRSDLLTINPMISADSRLDQLVASLGWEEVKQIPEVRRLFRTYASDVCRAEFGQDVWVRRAIPAIAEGGRVVISDVRMENEAAYVRRIGGFIVHVIRPGAGLGPGFGPHESEQPLPPHLVDAVVHNDGPLGEIPAHVQDLMAAIIEHTLPAPAPPVLTPAGAQISVVSVKPKPKQQPKPKPKPAAKSAKASHPAKAPEPAGGPVKKPRKKRVAIVKPYVPSLWCWECYRPLEMHSIGERRRCLAEAAKHPPPPPPV